MEPFTRVSGIAAPLPLDNVDTDAIIPSRETQSVARTGYAEKLFANWRYRPGTRIPEPGFVLNRSPYQKAVILVSRRNFGCGSSREAAVWALAQFGIRALIAESYGTIFRNNCVRNGVLPIKLPLDVVEEALRQLREVRPMLMVDLESSIVELPDQTTHSFSIDPRERDMLLAGADEVALTLRCREDIDKFRAADQLRRPWVYQIKRARV